MKKGYKICPFCANEIKEGAIKCQYCKEFLKIKKKINFPKFGKGISGIFKKFEGSFGETFGIIVTFLKNIWKRFKNIRDQPKNGITIDDTFFRNTVRNPIFFGIVFIIFGIVTLFTHHSLGWTIFEIGVGSIWLVNGIRLSKSNLQFSEDGISGKFNRKSYFVIRRNPIEGIIPYENVKSIEMYEVGGYARKLCLLSMGYTWIYFPVEYLPFESKELWILLLGKVLGIGIILLFRLPFILRRKKYSQIMILKNDGKKIISTPIVGKNKIIYEHIQQFFYHKKIPFNLSF